MTADLSLEDQAKRCRRLAGGVDGDLRHALLEMAKEYERLAGEAEAKIGNPMNMPGTRS